MAPVSGNADDEDGDMENVVLMDRQEPGRLEGTRHSNPGGIVGWWQSFTASRAGFSRIEDLEGGYDDTPMSRPIGRRWSPEEDSSIISKLFFIYVNSLMRLGASKHLEQDDVWDIAKGSVGTALVLSFGLPWIKAGLIKLAHDCVNLSSPFFLRKLLQHIQKEGDSGIGLGWALGLFSCGMTTAILVNQYFQRVYNVSLFMKSSLIQFLYEKSLRLSLTAKSTLGPGKVTNLQSNDAAKLYALPNYGHIIWSGPFQVSIIIFALHNIVGLWPALAGLCTTILLVPLNTITGKIVHRLRKELIAKTDARVKIITEMINGIKAIKLYAWEEPYKERLGRARAEERAAIRKTQLMSCINTVMFSGGPILVAISAFGTYAWLGNELTADVAFPALAYFDLLRFPIIMLPTQVMNFINASVALKRLQEFVDADEVEQMPETPAVRSKDEAAVAVVHGGFSWDPTGAPLLPDIMLSVPAGSLCIIVGEVGSGKSSLLAALLGEMPRIRGSVMVRGTVALTAQDPWIQNATVKANVLMGAECDQDKYDAVVEACALQADLESLQHGDATQIGEKGVTLSGGQKHRIALARACYAGADVALLDDPLSAVDAHVGRHLMDHAICGVLAPATRVLVTHQLQFLPQADLVIKLDKGRVQAMGTYDELIAKGVSFAEFKLEKTESSGEPEAEAPDGNADLLGDTNGTPLVSKGDASSSGSSMKENEANGEVVNGSGAKNGAAAATDKETLVVIDETLDVKAPSKGSQKGAGAEVKQVSGCKPDNTQEDRSKGSVSFEVYLTYLRAWGPGLLLPILYISIAFSDRTINTGQNFWLSYWSEKTLEHQKQAALQPFPSKPFPTAFYMTVYFSFGLVTMCVQATRAVLLVISTLNASQVLHDRLLDKVLSLPMSFFDTQPSGRLCNRFTRDVEATDVSLQSTINSFTTCSTSVTLSTLVIAGVTRGAVLLAMAPLVFVYRSIQQYYLATSRELKRLDSISMSPIFSNFGETLNGLMTIRAFRKQADFTATNENLLDSSARVWWPIQVGNRWLSIRLELMGQSIVLATALFVSLFITNSGLAGLALTSSLSVVGLMNWVTRQGTELELGMNSVERMSEYLTYDSERPAIIHDNRPPAHWPQQGALEVKDLVVRYREELPAVLKGVSFSVAPAQKVGVCGRTGCGKSTLMLALYRIVEPSSGSIVLDGIDVTRIGLRDLRTKLSLVPQDPVIFSGTVRSNLDPFGGSLDGDVWDALRQSGLQEAVMAMPKGLDTELQEGGSNLSVGQRQLLCMARALLKKARILLMDEATSNVDNATDSLIQTTIRSAFTHCTILTIAHRLHTIIDSDAILVLHAGEVSEYGPPSELMARSDSRFRALVQESAHVGGSGGLKSSPSEVALATNML